jgi:hypothetical protein
MWEISSALYQNEAGCGMQNMAAQPYVYFYGNKRMTDRGVWLYSA